VKVLTRNLLIISLAIGMFFLFNNLLGFSLQNGHTINILTYFLLWTPMAVMIMFGEIIWGSR